MLFSVFSHSITNAQHVIDSLEAIVSLTKRDTNQLKTLTKLSDKYIDINPGKAFLYGNKSLILAIELGNKNRISESYYQLGMIQYHFGNYDLALDNLNNSLKLSKTAKNKKGMLQCYKSIGVVHQNKGNYVKAVAYSFKALKKAEEIGDVLAKASIKGNLAIVSNLQGETKIALTYFNESLVIFKAFGTQSQVSTTLSNIGNVYLSQHKFNVAIDYYLRALYITENTQDKRLIAVSKSNLGVAYHNQKRYQIALDYFTSSYKFYDELGDKRSISLSCNNIGSTYLAQNKYDRAEVFFNKSLTLAKKIGAKELMKVGYQNLSELYSASKKYKKALTYYKLYVKLKDSIHNKEVTTKIANIQYNYEIEKKEKKVVLLEKNKIEQDFQLKKRNVVIYLELLSVFIISLLFILFVRNTKIKRAVVKEKQILLKERLTLKERELAATVSYIANKNNILSEIKDDLKDLLDSMNEFTTRLKLRSVITKIDGNLNVFDDWQNFKTQFDQIYPGYIIRLLKNYPNISHNDMKLCVYIKMGIANKEISQLQNMTLDGVKSANKRLKKKMKLPTNISLASFIKRF